MKSLFFSILIISLFILQSAKCSQDVITWSKIFGGDEDDWGMSVIQADDGNYFVTGGTSSYAKENSCALTPCPDLWVIKVGQNGDLIWSKTYGGDETDLGNAIIQTKDGNFIVVGATSSFSRGASDLWVIKINSDGDLIWSKTYGGNNGDWGNSLIETEDENLIITGGTNSFNSEGNYYSDLWLIKLDKYGNLIWTKSYGNKDYYEIGYSLSKIDDNNFIVTGGELSIGSGYGDLLLLKTDSEGNEIFTKTYGSDISYDVGYGLDTTTDNHIIITGLTGFGLLWLFKTDSEGKEIFSKTYGTNNYNVGYSIRETSDNGFIISGIRGYLWDKPENSCKYGGSFCSELWLLKTDSEGNEIFSKTYGGSNSSEKASDVKETNDNGFIITGVKGYAGICFDPNKDGICNFGNLDDKRSDLYLIKTDKNGNAPLL